MPNLPEGVSPLGLVPFTVLICDTNEIKMQNVQTSFKYRISHELRW